jgi:hypothetical protein
VLERDFLKEKVLLIIFDGFSSNYLQKNLCPNLYKIAHDNYFSLLTPLFGFQGVGAAIFSGASMNTTGIFSEFVYENKLSPSKSCLNSVLKITDYIPNDWLCQVSRQLSYKLFRKRKRGLSNVIPSKLLKYFTPKLAKPFYAANSLGKILTIFDVLRLNDLSYFYNMPSTRSENILFDHILQGVKDSNLPNLTAIHPCSLDIIAHHFGPDSSQVKCALEEIDTKIFNLHQSIQRSHEPITVLIMSDHGMTPVGNQADVFGVLKDLPIALEKDYLFFLDSTLARFWFFTEKAKNLVSDRLSSLSCGKILDAIDMKMLGIDGIGPEYGELFFTMNEKWVIYPDFFRRHRPPLGMHGYAYSTFDAPILIAFSLNSQIDFKRRKNVRFINIMPSILDLFGLPVPKTCEGASLRT